MSLFKALLTRLCLALLALFGVWFITFLLIRVMPGSPLDPEYYDKLPPAQLEQLEKSMLEPYGARGPLLKGATKQLGRLLQGDLGDSFVYEGRSVWELISGALPVSMTLGLFALLLSLITGVFLGTVSAMKRGSWLDLIFSGLATLGICLPVFVIAGGFLIFFSFKLNLLPGGGWGSWKQLILPGLALAFPYTAVFMRLTRNSLLEQLGQDYLRTARAKGLSPFATVTRHALGPALIPIYGFLGPALAQILTGSLVIEYIFGIPGVAGYFVEAALARDYPLLIGAVLFYTGFLLIFNQLMDIWIAWTDPRVELNSGKASKKKSGGFIPLKELLKTFYILPLSMFALAWHLLHLLGRASLEIFRRKHISGMIGVFLMLLMLGYVLLVPLGRGEEINRHRTETKKMQLLEPGTKALFGTDEFGRDLFLRTASAGRTSLLIGAVAAILILLIGTLYGLLSAYAGGLIDQGMQRFLDMLDGLPYIFFVIYLLSFQVFERYRFTALLFALAVVGWLSMARIIRAKTLTIKQAEFVQAANAFGMDTPGILSKHILPNLIGIMITYAVLTVPAIIMQESFLSFLGLGIRAPAASWGSLAMDGFTALNPFDFHWWLIFFPCLALTLTLLGLNLLGDAFRDVLDNNEQ